MNLHDYLLTYSTAPLQCFSACRLDFTHPKRAMSAGPLVGGFLQCLVYLHKPKYLLEIGTFVGYTSLCLAEAMCTDAQLYTVEKNAAHYAQAQKNFAQVPQKDRIHALHGDAHQLLTQELHEQFWDFIFLDAEKTNYPQYYDALIDRMASGATLCVDNALFHLEVLQHNKNRFAQAVHDLNERARQDNRVHTVLVNIRDGINLITKR